MSLQGPTGDEAKAEAYEAVKAVSHQIEYKQIEGEPMLKLQAADEEAAVTGNGGVKDN